MAEQEKYKTTADARVTITELMIPSYSNFGGKIHGGIILSLIDKVAYATATRHAGTYCVTLSVNDVIFLHPVEVGQLVSLEATVDYVGNSSMIVGVRVHSEDVKSGEVRHTNSCYLTMVAVDGKGGTVRVPGLTIESAEGARRWYKARLLRQQEKSLREKQEDSDDFTLGEIVKAIESERCQINLD